MQSQAVIPEKYLDGDVDYHLQPSGKFVIGGPQASGNMQLSIASVNLSRSCIFTMSFDYMFDMLFTGRCRTDRTKDHC